MTPSTKLHQAEESSEEQQGQGIKQRAKSHQITWKKKAEDNNRGKTEQTKGDCENSGCGDGRIQMEQLLPNHV